jgi:hypothetical protein
LSNRWRPAKVFLAFLSAVVMPDSILLTHAVNIAYQAIIVGVDDPTKPIKLRKSCLSILKDNFNCPITNNPKPNKVSTSSQR